MSILHWLNPLYALHSALHNRILLFPESKMSHKNDHACTVLQRIKMKSSILHYCIYSSLLFYITAGSGKGKDKTEAPILKKQDSYSSFKTLWEIEREQPQLSKTVFITCCFTEQAFDIVIFCVPQNSTSACFGFWTCFFLTPLNLIRLFISLVNAKNLLKGEQWLIFKVL